MLSPWRRPEDGKFYLRARVPTRLAAVAKRKLHRIPLGTKCPIEARARWPDALRAWEAQKAEWERQIRRVSLSPEQAAEIAVQWGLAIASGAMPLDMGGGGSFQLLPRCSKFYSQAEWDRHAKRTAVHAEEALRLAGITITDESVPLLLECMSSAVVAAYLQASLRAAGVRGDNDNTVFSPLTAPLVWRGLLAPPSTAAVNEQAPANGAAMPAHPPETVQAGCEVHFDDLWAAWARITTAKARTVDETRYMLRGLQAFLGHDDAARVTPADIRRWRQDCLDKGLTNNTFNNRLSLVRQVFAWGMRDGMLASNPTDGMRLPKSKPAQRHPYTDEQAVRILEAARRESTPSLRWAHFVMAFTGMRVAEVLQLTGGDVRRDGASGIWFLAVHEAGEGKSVKNGEARNVPIHPALLAEGFLDYAQGISGDAPLFPDKGTDKYGQRGGRGWNQVGEWVRKVVGITDRALAPNHSWRHRMEDELRTASVPEDVRDALLGHARQTTGRLYGVRGEALARLHDAIMKVPVPRGLALPHRPARTREAA